MASGRKAERTDYVYVAVAVDEMGPPTVAFRTLDGALTYAAQELTDAVTKKIDKDVWTVTSGIIEGCQTVIGRMALRA